MHLIGEVEKKKSPSEDVFTDYVRHNYFCDE